jgi:excisionase family DNA binding protein
MHADAAPSNPVHGNIAPATEQMAYSVQSAARVLDLSVRKVWELVAEGEIESFKVGKSRRIRREALVAFVNQGTAA